MKKIHNLAGAVAVAALFPASAMAEDVCPALGDLAQKIMNGRQNGTPMSVLMEKAASVAKNSPDIAAVARALIMDAYAVSQYSVQKNRDQAELDFRNAAELACYSATR